MDLDDVLEDLLKGARRAMRDGGARGSSAVRNGIPLVAIIVGVWWTIMLALMAVGTLAVTDGSVGTVVAAGLGALGLAGVPVAGWGVTERRRRRQLGEQARSEKAHTRDARARAAAMPAEVRDDWRRMEQARELVGELAMDGWISDAAVVELDEHVAHLQKVAWADHRTRELGGRSADRLSQQVADLADLLVALADEAVDHQAEVAAGARAPATLGQARDRMAALRAARREVADVDTAPQGRTSTG